jgi:DNA polymerase-3 subunit beta
MDITVQREALLKPLQAVSGIAEKKQTQPILSNVMLTIKDHKLLLTTTDLEIELIGFCQISDESVAGSTTVAAKKLFDICRSLQEGVMVRLKVEQDRLIVSAGASHFKLNILAIEDFPSLEASNYQTKFPIKQGQLKNLLTKTYFAMAQQDVRYYLNGTLIDINQGAITCVAADGHRLALASLKDENVTQVESRVILPRRSVIELIRLLGNNDDNELTIEIGENRFRIVTNDYIFTSKLINAKYPDYNLLIPQGNFVATGEREEIKQALVRASILSNEKFRGVRFQLEPSKLRIIANNADQEHAEDAVSINYEGDSMEISFNVAYWLDAISVMTAKSIRCAFTNANNGVLIESGDAGRDHNLYVVMPMRL